MKDTDMLRFPLLQQLTLVLALLSSGVSSVNAQGDLEAVKPVPEFPALEKTDQSVADAAYTKATQWRYRTPHNTRDIPDAEWDRYAREIPQWYQDAKFGIYAHWGPYNLGMEESGFSGVNNSWYPKYIFAKGHPYNVQHEKVMGPLMEFGYKDYFPMFTVPEFDPTQWADLIAGSGAKFAGPVAMHHDGFAMWDSKVVPWNSVSSGAKRDIAGELIAAYRQRGLKIVSSFHNAFNVTGHYYGGREERPDDGPVVLESDLTDPQYAKLHGKFATQQEAEQYWLDVLKEYITKYQPDQLWFDGGLKRISEEKLFEMTSFYYDFCKKNGIEGIISQKRDQIPRRVSLFDYERGGANAIADRTWQTDDSPGPWMFIEAMEFKGSDWVTRLLVDIVSKNGVLLLNIAPLSDGSIHPPQQVMLRETGEWMKANGEAIYETRPWTTHHQGDEPFFYGGGKAFSKSYAKFGEDDLRFTRSQDGRTLYVFAMGEPAKQIAIESLSPENLSDTSSVSLLGAEKSLALRASEDGQVIVPMEQLISEANVASKGPLVFKLTGLNTPFSVAE